MSIRFARFSAILTILLCLLQWPVGAALAEAPWGAPLDLAQATADVDEAVVAVDASGSVHVVWSEQGSLYHRQKVGHVWSARQWVASGASPDLAADGSGDLWLCFSNLFEGAEEIYVMRRSAAGAWGLPQNISQTENDSHSPRLTRAMSGELALVWVEATPREGLIYVAQSSDGELWSAAPLPDATGDAPVAAFDAAGALTVAWEDVYDLGYPKDVYVARQQGVAWSLPENVSYSPDVNSSAPTLAGGAGGLYLAWQEGEPGVSAIYTSRYVSDGWQAPTPRSSVGANSTPSLALGSGTGYLVWSSEVGLSQRIFDLQHPIWVNQPDLIDLAAGATGARLAVATRQHLVWIAIPEGQSATVYYAERAAGENRFAAAALPLVRRR